MTLVKRGRIWHYDFEYRKQRYQKSTEQELREDAEQVERDVKRQLRREAKGIATVDREQTPGFSAWAERFLAEKRKRLTRIDVLERTVRMVLAFWGERPADTTPVTGGVYRNLRLFDPIEHPELIDAFEDWMAVRMLSESAKLSYYSALSGMYKLALLPRWRTRTRVTANPFDHIDRPRPQKRKVTATVDDLREWLRQSAPHARLAMTIGALAPKLRHAQILALRFDRHFDRELTRIVFEAHKTRRHTHEDQVTPVPADLRLVLEAVRRSRPGATHVITYRGKPVKSIKRATASGAKRAGLAYGLKAKGVTFHAIRKIMGAECARIGVGEVLASALFGHKDPRTTREHYQHMIPADERAASEQLAAHLGLADETVKMIETPTKSRRMSEADKGRILATAQRFRSRARA